MTKMGMPYKEKGGPRVMLAPPYITDKPAEAKLSDGTKVLVQGQHGKNIA